MHPRFSVLVQAVCGFSIVLVFYSALWYVPCSQCLSFDYSVYHFFAHAPNLESLIKRFIFPFKGIFSVLPIRTNDMRLSSDTRHLSSQIYIFRYSNYDKELVSNWYFLYHRFFRAATIITQHLRVDFSVSVNIFSATHNFSTRQIFIIRDRFLSWIYSDWYGSNYNFPTKHNVIYVYNVLDIYNIPYVYNVNIFSDQ